MYEAYNEKKDLYAMIAQSAFNNRYEDNLEYFVPGQEVEVDGKMVTAGSGEEYKVQIGETGVVSAKNWELLSTKRGEVAASSLKIGDVVVADGGEEFAVENVESANSVTMIALKAVL